MHLEEVTLGETATIGELNPIECSRGTHASLLYAGVCFPVFRFGTCNCSEGQQMDEETWSLNEG